MKEKNNFFDKITVICTVICVVAISLAGCVFLLMEHIDKSTIIKSNTGTKTENLIDKLLQNEETATEKSSKNQYLSEVFGLININTAKKEELLLLPGIGDVKADAIITYRTNTTFKKTEDIMKVKGIGRKTFEKIKDIICAN